MAVKRISREEVLARLDVERFYSTRIEGALLPAGKDRWKGRCPFHEDRNPSLSVQRKTGLFKCVGCGAHGSVFDFEMALRGIDFPTALSELAREAGLSVNEESEPRVVATYDWRDAEGELIWQKVRYDPKDFRVRRPDGRGGWIYNLDGIAPMLYHADLVAATAEQDEPVWLFEGEKDADEGMRIGVLGTTSGGATSWRPELAAPLAGRRVRIVPHQDERGERYAQAAAMSLHGVATSLRVVRLPRMTHKGADFADWVVAGGTREQLLKLAEAAPEWEPRAVSVQVVAEPTLQDHPGPEWPAALTPAAFGGPAGDFVRLVDPHTEADPAAVLLSFLVAFGSLVGRGPHFVADAASHFANLFCVIVGVTSRSRKGSSWAQVTHLLGSVDSAWADSGIKGGMSSGEGLIWAVRDPIERKEPIREKKRVVGYQTVVDDHGVEDKRLLVAETEFAMTLQVMMRQGNTLSAIVRQAWDTGSLRVLTKNSPAKATGAHISIVGHITRGELLRHLNATEAANGFGNRFLWACADRSKVLPEGGRIQEVDFAPLVQRIRGAIDFARGVREMQRDAEARGLWHEVYPRLSEGLPGLLGAIVARAEAQVMRLACVYALLDESEKVRRKDLEAALALWRYCEDSARFIFGDALGDPIADTILRALRRAGNGLTRTEISALFGRNVEASRISHALALLEDSGLAACRLDPAAGGRPAERWYATRPGHRTRNCVYERDE